MFASGRLFAVPQCELNAYVQCLALGHLGLSASVHVPDGSMTSGPLSCPEKSGAVGGCSFATKIGLHISSPVAP